MPEDCRNVFQKLWPIIPPGVIPGPKGIAVTTNITKNVTTVMKGLVIFPSPANTHIWQLAKVINNQGKKESTI